MKCLCRTCQKEYKEDRATADYKGYCSQKCLHQKSRELGWTLYKQKTIRLTEYEVLRRNGQIGSIPVGV